MSAATTSAEGARVIKREFAGGEPRVVRLFKPVGRHLFKLGYDNDDCTITNQHNIILGLFSMGI